MTPQFQVPDETDLSNLFAADPIERNVEDGYWCYEVSDDRGARLRFSFNIYERSVQTTLSLNEAMIMTVSQEGASRMLIRDGALTCEFAMQSAKTTLTVELGRRVTVVWSTLRTR
jgi:hypothetical protein